MHTPGPWIAAPYSSVVGAPVVSASGRSVAKVTYFALGESFSNHDAESDANARLIAAAPEMLEALRMYERGEEATVLAATVRAAIAKAEGRA
jgi:hypothetical protein